MSATQNQLILQQRQIQQRQILAMMGIEQWVRPDSPTTEMTSISNEGLEQLTSQQPVATAENVADLNADTLDTSLSVIAEHSLVNEQTPAIKDAKTTDTQQVAQALEPLVEQLSVQDNIRIDIAARADPNVDKIAPFDLQGGRYNNWVLLVDIQALSNDSEKLWQNVTQALSLTCETTSFPICAGMDSAELANASLAGYIFKIGRSEEVQVAALTDLPDGLVHPNLVSVPTLDNMLSDSKLKHQFWQQLSNQEEN